MPKVIFLRSVRVFYAAAQGDAGAGPGIVPASGQGAPTRCRGEFASEVSGEWAERVRGQGPLPHGFGTLRASLRRQASRQRAPALQEGVASVGAGSPANVAQKVKRSQRPRGGGSAKRHKRPAPSEPGDRGSWRREGIREGCGSAAERSPPPRGALAEPPDNQCSRASPLPQVRARHSQAGPWRPSDIRAAAPRESP